MKESCFFISVSFYKTSSQSNLSKHSDMHAHELNKTAEKRNSFTSSINVT